MTTLQPARRGAAHPDAWRFEIRIQPDRDRVIVAPCGELDIATVDRVRAEIAEIVAAGFGSVVLDLRGLSFIDSTGLRLIVEQAGRRDLTLQLIDGPPPVARLFDLTGLRSTLPFVEPRQLRVRR
jgi:anti-sigma B factor antagonist